MMLCQRERIKKAFQSEGKEIRISSEAIPTNEREKSGKGDFIHYIWEVQANGMVCTTTTPTNTRRRTSSRA